MLDNQSESLICHEGGAKFYRWLARERFRPDSKTLLILAHVSTILSYWWKSCKSWHKSSWVLAPLLFESITFRKNVAIFLCFSNATSYTGSMNEELLCMHACNTRKHDHLPFYFYLFTLLHNLIISSLHMPSVYGYRTMLAWCLEHFQLHMNELGGVNVP